MSHDVFDTQAAAYALGALDGEDLRDFEAHLATGCAECRAAVRGSREALARAAMAGPPLPPPADVRRALLRRAAVTAAPSAEARRRAAFGWARWSALTAAAMVATAFFTGMLVAGRYEARLGVVRREMLAVRDQLQREEARLRADVAGYRDVVELLRDPRTRIVGLRGAGPAPEAVARVVWHPTAGGQLLVANLPPAPAGKAYELWTITGGTPRPAGVFQVDARGQASHRIDAAAGASVDVFAVTLEPAAGVPAPTGPIVLASSK